MTNLILQSRGLSRVLSNTTVQSINSPAFSFLYDPTLTSIHDHGKNCSLRLHREALPQSSREACEWYRGWYLGLAWPGSSLSSPPAQEASSAFPWLLSKHGCGKKYKASFARSPDSPDQMWELSLSRQPLCVFKGSGRYSNSALFLVGSPQSETSLKGIELGAVDKVPSLLLFWRSHAT